MGNGTGPVFLLAAVKDGRLLIAPVGTPFDVTGPGWIDGGPAPEHLARLTARTVIGTATEHSIQDPFTGEVTLQVLFEEGDPDEH